MRGSSLLMRLISRFMLKGSEGGLVWNIKKRFKGSPSQFTQGQLNVREFFFEFFIQFLFQVRRPNVVNDGGHI